MRDYARPWPNRMLPKSIVIADVGEKLGIGLNPTELHPRTREPSPHAATATLHCQATTSVSCEPD